MSLRWRLGSVAALVLLLGYLALANFFAEERRAQAWFAWGSTSRVASTW